VQHYVIKGSGHAWPGGTAPRAQADQPVDTIDINELIWAFFSQH
jgi:polyhydroxybutyrate depolymerase